MSKKVHVHIEVEYNYKNDLLLLTGIVSCLLFHVTIFGRMLLSAFLIRELISFSILFIYMMVKNVNNKQIKQ
jgi:hypothetical protein